jgi:hypothetical protein
MIKWILHSPSKILRNFYRRIGFRSISKARVSAVPDDQIPSLFSVQSRDEARFDVMLFCERVSSCYTVYTARQYSHHTADSSSVELSSVPRNSHFDSTSSSRFVLYCTVCMYSTFICICVCACVCCV